MFTGNYGNYSVGIQINNWQLSSLENYKPSTYNVHRDDRLLNSIHSLKEIGATPAYEVDFSTEYKTMSDAYAAMDKIYGNTSIVRSEAADKLAFDMVQNTRSAAEYLGVENPEARKMGGITSFWQNFQADETYRKYAAQGGTENEMEVEELTAAAEAYRWRTSYALAGVYEADMFDFADKLKENTGVTVITKGVDTSMRFSLNDKIATMDNFTFQFMAKHQDHMDIWEKAVSHEFNGFEEMAEAIYATDDETLKADWERVITKGTMKKFVEGINKEYDSKYGHNFGRVNWEVHTLHQYVSVSLKADTLYDSQMEGSTGKDFWNELNYNLGVTNTYSNKRDIQDLVDTNGMHFFGQALEDALYKKSGRSNHQTVAQHEAGKPFEEQIAAIRDKIKALRKKMSALHGISEMTEAQKKQMEGYKKEMASYEQQIAAILSQELEEKEKHIQR